MQQKTKRAANKEYNEKERNISREQVKSKVSVGGVKTDCSKKAKRAASKEYNVKEYGISRE